MAEKKTTSRTKKTTRATSKKSTQSTRSASKRPAKPTPPAPRSGFFGAIQDFLEDPDAFKNLKDKLPSWSDEVGGIALIMIGILTFAAVLNPSGDAALSASIADSLLQTFGWGSYFVALTVFAFGVILLLPKVGIRVQFNWVRILALEIAFVSLEGLFHLLTFDNEARALARAGKGGGYVGWAISNLIAKFTGSWPAILILSVCLIYSLMLFLKITRRDIRQFLLGIGTTLENLAIRLQPEPEPMVIATTETSGVDTPITETPAEPAQVFEPVVEESPEPTLGQWQGSAPAYTSPVSRPDFMPPTELPSTPVAESQPEPTPEPPASWPGITPIFAEELSESAANAVTAPFEANIQNSEKSVSAPIIEETPSTSEPAEEEIEYKVMMINGEEVQIPINNRPAEAVMSPIMDASQRRIEGQRYFTVDGFQDRYIWSDERDMMLPPMELLQYADLKLPEEEEVNNNAKIINHTMEEFDIDADVIDVRIGPTVTQYAISPFKEVDNDGNVKLVRTRVSKIANLSSDFALALSTKRLRIQAPVPGTSYVGIEVPNREPSIVSIRSVMETDVFYRKRHLPLVVPLGRDVSGDPILADLASMPHLLVAGTTGSGKSVCLTSMITSLILNNQPTKMRLILLDPKMVELTRFGGVPHLLGPVETETERIIGVLRWAAREMDRRYKLLELENARNLETYNTLIGAERAAEHMPYIVIVIDEIGDLMMTRPDETEKTVTRLAQKARAAGMHLIIATQRPSVDVITGLIKANFPARLSFAVASGTDSRVILDSVGAETLIGRGDMLFLAPDAAGPQRLQGCYISDEEITEIVMYWRAWEAERLAEEGTEIDNRVAPWEQSLTRLESLTKLDPILEEALQMVVAEGRASVSQLQKRMGIDYPRAARLMDSLLDLGIVGGTMQGGRNRKVLVKSVEEARRMVHNNRRSQEG